MTVLYKFIAPTMNNFIERYINDHSWYIHVSTIEQYIPGYDKNYYQNAVQAFGAENVRCDDNLGIILTNCIYKYEFACLQEDTNDYERNMIEQQIMQLYTMIHIVIDPTYQFRFPLNGDMYFNIISDKYLMKYKSSYGIENTGEVKYFTARNLSLFMVLGVDIEGNNSWENEDMAITVLDGELKGIIQLVIKKYTLLVLNFIDLLDRNFDDDFGIRLSSQKIILE